MKKFLTLFLTIVSMSFAATNDIKISQRTSAGTWVDKIFAPSTNTLFGFDSSGHPISIVAGSNITISGSTISSSGGSGGPGSVTSIDVSGGSTGLSFAGGPVTTSGTITASIGNAAIFRAAISLGNVDNTSDVNKPVSTAQQTALNAKQATLVSATNIKTINGVTLLGSGDMVISGGGTGVSQNQETITTFATAGNSNVTPPTNSNFHTAFVTAGAGSGAYVRTLVVLTSNSPTAGEEVRIVVALPASKNPTVEIRNATSGGTLLASITNPGATADAVPVDLIYTGSAWVRSSSTFTRTKDLPNVVTSFPTDAVVEFDSATTGPGIILGSNISGGGGGGVTRGNLTDGSSISWNLATVQLADLTLTASGHTLNVTNIANNAIYHLLLKPSVSTMTWSSSFIFAGGTAPTLSVGANAYDEFEFIALSDNTKLLCTNIKQNFTVGGGSSGTIFDEEFNDVGSAVIVNGTPADTTPNGQNWAGWNGGSTSNPSRNTTGGKMHIGSGERALINSTVADGYTVEAQVFGDAGRSPWVIFRGTDETVGFRVSVANGDTFDWQLDASGLVSGGLSGTTYNTSTGNIIKVVVTGSTLKLYVDGVLQSTQTNSAHASLTTVGFFTQGGRDGFAGYMKVTQP